MYQAYGLVKIMGRRALVILGYLALLPCLPFIKQPAKYTSVLYRMWIKTSNKPVWIQRSEEVGPLY
ncbi:DUF2517 family protein [Motilimonas eburnea]|uniref:DUF2517 family protein n=1 Tax=Motilimonas eburnea TaxID=1737488 RepID=UPI001E5EC6D7|nr:DUF2517 family protein [Motilimonas eburnea]MCE2570091.1 YbfA family protein [Motilimonas eburnea]